MTGWSSKFTNDRCNSSRRTDCRRATSGRGPPRGRARLVPAMRLTFAAHVTANVGRVASGGGRSRPRLALASLHGPFRHRLQLPRLRASEPQVAWALPRVRRMELARGGGACRAGRPGGTGQRPRRRRLERPGAASGGAARRAGAEGRAPEDRNRRVRPRPGRRPRPGLARPDRRLAGDRQVDPHQRGARQPRRGRAQGAVRVGRGVRGPGQAARGAPRRRRAERADRGGDRPRRRPRDARERAARGLRDRLGAGALRLQRSAARPDRSARCARSPGA